MKKILLVSLILLFAMSCNYKANIGNGEDIAVTKFDIVQKTTSNFRIIEKNVGRETTKGKLYVEKRIENGKLISVELFDDQRKPIDDLYQPFKILFKYNLNDQPDTIQYFDSNKNAVLDPFLGFHMASYFYDHKNRIKEIRYFGTSGKPLENNILVDSKTALEEFTYSDKIVIKKTDSLGNVISLDTIEYEPEVPYLKKYSL